jgi:hypothetical protein
MANHEKVVEYAKLCTEEKEGDKNIIIKGQTLYAYVEKSGRWRKWTPYIEASDKDGNPMMLSIEAAINKEDLYDKIYYYAIYGLEDGQLTKSKPSETKPKNARKVNATTNLTQAFLEVISAAESKVDEGYTPNKRKVTQNPEIPDLTDMDRNGTPMWRVAPMALYTIQKYPKKIKFPCMTQEKQDGHMFIVVYHPSINSPYVDVDPTVDPHIDGYTRGRETTLSQIPLLKEMTPMCKANPGLYFVGELYNPGTHLQFISSIVRDAESRVRISFNVFDAFRLNDKRGFAVRFKELETIMAKFEDGLDRCRLLPAFKCENQDAIEEYHKQFIDNGREGSVIRNMDSVYEYGLNGKEKRVSHALKYKNRQDMEFPVVGYTEGRGSNAGLVIWECAVPGDEVKSKKEDMRTFTVNQIGDQELRRKIFTALTENPKLFDGIRGQMFTVDFMALSADGLPREPIGKMFRDFNVYKHLGIKL